MPYVRVGVKNAHIAIMTSDSSVGVVYGEPIKLEKLIGINKKTATSKAVIYADDAPADVLTTTGETTVSVNVSELTLAQKALLLGHSVVGGVMKSNSEDQAPYVALMFESKKSNSAIRYVKLLKGMAVEPDEDFKTKSGNAEGQTDTIEFTFIRRDYDKDWKYDTDTDHPDYVPNTGATWYDGVESAADTTPPTVTCVPLDEATNVAAGTTVALTFSETMTASSLAYGESFILQKNDGTQVAGAGSWNTGHTVYTFTPSTALTAGATYNAIVTKAVKDLADNHLAAVNEFTFTIAA